MFWDKIYIIAEINNPILKNLKTEKAASKKRSATRRLKNDGC